MKSNCKPKTLTSIYLSSTTLFNNRLTKANQLTTQRGVWCPKVQEVSLSQLWITRPTNNSNPFSTEQVIWISLLQDRLTRRRDLRQLMSHKAHLRPMIACNWELQIISKYGARRRLNRWKINQNRQLQQSPRLPITRHHQLPRKKNLKNQWWMKRRRKWSLRYSLESPPKKTTAVMMKRKRKRKRRNSQSQWMKSTF